MKRFALTLLAATLGFQTVSNAQPASTQASKTGNAAGLGSPSDPTAAGPSVSPPSSAIPQQGSAVRGAPESGATSDKEASRTWSGIGSTGGGTGTGTSSGVAQDPPSAGGAASGAGDNAQGGTAPPHK